MVQGPLSLMQLFEADSSHQKALTKLSVNPSPVLENLVFEGGGSKGIAYIGALEALEERNLLKSVKRVAGSSAGGIMTTLLAVGYSPEEIKQIITKDLDLKDLMDERTSWDPKFLKVKGMPLGISSFVNLFKHRGVFKGDAFKAIATEIIEKKILSQMQAVIRKREEKTIENLKANYRQQQLSEAQIESLIEHFIKEKVSQLCETYYIASAGTITFGQIQSLKNDYPEFEFKDLYLTGTKLSDNPSLKVFSHETDPNMPIIDALRITMSFPFGFEPVYYQGSYYADGGIANNYPMGIFDKPKYLSHGLNHAGVNPCTLGFLVDSNDEIENRWGIKPSKIKNNLKLKNFVSSLLSTIHFRSDIIFEKYHTNTIQLFDLEIATLDFNLTDTKTKQAVESGKEQTSEYLDHYEYIGDGLEVDVVHKYYSCTLHQLQKIREELLEGIRGCHEVREQLDDIRLDSFLEFCNDELKQHSSALIEDQRALFDQNRILQEQLALNYSKRERLTKELKQEEREERNLIRRMKHEISANFTPDKQASEILKKLQNEYVIHITKKKRIEASLEESEWMIEHNLLSLKANEEIQDPKIYDLVYQLEMARYIDEQNIEERTIDMEQRYHEHLDVVLEAMDAMGEPAEDIRITPPLGHQTEDQIAEESVEPFENPDALYAQSIKELSRRLRTGLWSDFILTESKSDVFHNFNHMKRVDNETTGKHQSGFQVESFIKIPKYKRKRAGYSWSQESLPVEMNLLIPDLATMRNPNKKNKDIVLVFHEPLTEDHSKSEKYSVMNKYCTNRSRDFDQVKTSFVKQLKLAVRRIKENDPNSDSSRINLTLSGAGLGGLDAQFMLNALIQEMNESNDSDLNSIHSIDLMLDNSPRVSSKIARKFQVETQSLKARPRSPKLSMYQTRQVQPSGEFLPHCYLGQVDLSAYTDPNFIRVALETQNTETNKFNTFSNQENPDSLYQKLHRKHWMYGTSVYKSIQVIEKKFLEFGRWLLTKCVPTLFKVAKVAAIVLGVVGTYPLRFAFRVGSRLFKKIKNRHKNKKAKDTKLWSSLIQTSKSEPSLETSHRPPEIFLQETELSNRMKREQRPPIENLVFGGGGVDSHAFVGVLRELDSSGHSEDVKRVLGGDVGAVISTLYALGFKPTDIEKLLNNELNFNNLKDEAFEWDPKLFKLGSHRVAASSIISLFKNKGLYKGDAFKQVMSTLIEDKLKHQIKTGLATRMNAREKDFFLTVDEPLREKMIDQFLDTEVSKLLKRMEIPSLADSTFEQIKQISTRFPELNIKDIYVTGSCLDDNSLKVFSHEKTPNMRLIDALRITNAYPGLYYPVEYEGKVYVAGQLSDSYPIPFFDHPNYLSHGLNESNVNPCTLGFIVDSPKNISERWGVVDEQPKDVSLFTVAHKVIRGMNTQTERSHGNYQINTIQIANKGISGGFQNLTLKEKKQLVDSGRLELSNYISNYMGSDVRYDTRKGYSNYYHKFFQKPEQELIRIFKEELHPLIREAQYLQALLGENNEARESRLTSLKQGTWLPDSPSLEEAFYNASLNYFKTRDELLQLERLNQNLSNEIASKKALLKSLPPESHEKVELDNEVLHLQAKLKENSVWLRHLKIKENQHFVSLQSISPRIQHSDLIALEEYTQLHTESKNSSALQLRVVELHAETDVLFEALQSKHSKFLDPRKDRIPEKQKSLFFSKAQTKQKPRIQQDHSVATAPLKPNQKRH